MKAKKIISLFLFFIVVFAIFASMGQYIGGAVFLKLSHIDWHTTSYDTLYYYYNHYQDDLYVMKRLKGGFAAAGFISGIPVFIFIMMLFGLIKREELHGSARLGNDMDLSKSNLFPKKKDFGKSKHPEILIGKMSKGRFKGQYLRFSGQQFVFVSAPTRSGKGVGLVIPNLLNYRDSVVVLDIKRENFMFTGGFRHFKGGQDVFLFSPDGYIKDLDEEAQGIVRSHRWNPLFYISRDPLFRDADVMIIARILFPLTGGENDFWSESAANLFKGLVLYMMDNEASGMPVTLPFLLRLTAPDDGLAVWMKNEINVASSRGKPLSENCIAEFNRFIAAPDRTQGNILASLTAPLGIFGNPVCAAATSGNDFDLREVRKKRMSIYFGISPNSLSSYSRLINLFFSQLINLNTKVLPEIDKGLKNQCLLVLDEFTSMGRVDIIQKSIAYTAGYNLRYMIIIQGKSQLEDDKLYGKTGAKTIVDNCAVQIIYPPKEADEEAKRVSETIGYKTVKSRSRSRTHGEKMSRGDNISDQKRAVMMPQEVVDLGREEHLGISQKEIIIMEKTRPFIADKIIYFDEEKEADFLNRKIFSENNVVEIPPLDFSEVGKFPLPKNTDTVPVVK